MPFVPFCELKLTCPLRAFCARFSKAAIRLAHIDSSLCDGEILMTNVKCIRCGALNLSSAQICKVCEIELNPIRPPVAEPGRFVFQSPAARWETSSTSSTTIGPFNGVGDVLGPTFSLIKSNFWLITKIVVVIVAPFEIFKALNIERLGRDEELIIGVYLLDILCRILIAPALIYSLTQVMQTGIAPGLNEAYRWGFSKLGKVALCVVLAFILEGIGVLLCLIPGIILMVALILVEPIAVLEKGSVPSVLRKSCELTRGHRWKIFGASIVMWILIGLFSLPELATQSLVFNFWPVHALAAIFSDIAEQSSIVFSLVTYLSIRALWSQSTQ